MFQGAIDLDEVVSRLQPFLVVVQHNDSMQVYIAVEKMLESENIYENIIDLISVYFTFDIAYPKQLYPLCLFLQHHVL